MKKYFNIKKISVVIFTFFCMLLATNDVKAAGKYVCYYIEPIFDIKSTDFYSKDKNVDIDEQNSRILIQLTYENGNASFKYYDFKEKITYEKIGELDNENSFYNISPQSGKQLTDADFASGCPATIDRLKHFTTYDGYVYDIFKPGTEEYKQMRETPMKNSIWAKTDDKVQNMDGVCYREGNAQESYTRKICEKLIYIAIKDTIDEQEISGNGKTCSYVNENLLKQDRVFNFNLNPQMVLMLNKEQDTITIYNGLNSNPSDTVANFTIAELNGECPNIIYSDTSPMKNFYLTAGEVPKDKSRTKFYRIKYLSKSDVPTPKTGCDSLGGLKKYIIIGYTLLKYMIPFLIIIFSVIDFLGVVFSGESEKMEKAKKKFAIRLVVGFIVLIIPAVLELLLKLSNIIENNQSLADLACNIFK